MKTTNFITIPKSLFEDSNLSHRELMNRVEKVAKKQLENKGEHR